MTFQVILYIKNPQKKGEKLYGDKMERADNRKSVGRNLLEYPVCDRFTFLCLNWMKELSAFTTTDARNEASVILAKKIFEHNVEFLVLEEKHGETREYPELKSLNANEVVAVLAVYLEKDAANGYQEFLLKLRKEHRTLQQNFTRFAMRWLRDAGKKNPKLSWIREIKIWLPCI